MKPVSPELETYLATKRQFIYADGYTLTLLDETKHRFTTSQYNFIGIPQYEVDPQTFFAGRLLISGLKYKTAIGTEVDEQELRITPFPNYEINQVKFLRAARIGMLDGALVKRDRFFFNAWGQPPVGAMTLFKGRTSTIDPIGRTDMSMKIKSDLVLLVSPSPREAYQPQCQNTLFDGRCKLLKEDFAVQGTAGSGSTDRLINWTTGSAAGFYDQGTVFIETGDNVGELRTIQASSTNQLFLTLPLPYPLANGDDFVVLPGCDKTKEVCQSAKFDNLENFRGYPFVPPPETAY